MTDLKNHVDVPMLVSPPLTPFHEDGSVDYTALGVEIEYMLQEVRPSLFAVGAVEAQEYQYLSDQERGELIRRTAQIIGNRAPMVVGVSHPSIHKVKELCALARELEAVAVQGLIPRRPTGGEPLIHEMVEYFEAVSYAARLPIILYHNPGPGAKVDPVGIAQLFKVKGVEACKESLRNMRHIGLTRSLIPDDGMYLSTMEVLLGSLAIGCDGATVPPPASAVARRLIDAFMRGDDRLAYSLQGKFMNFPGKWMRYGLVAIMKEALQAIGVPIGSPYPPFGKMEEQDQKELSAFIRSELVSIFKEN